MLSKLAPRSSSRINAAAAEAYLRKAACASKSEMNREVNLWGPGGLVTQRQFDEKKHPKKNAFQKTAPIWGTLSVPNPGTRLVPRLVRFFIMRCSIMRQGLTHRFRKPCHEFSMPLLAIWAAQHFNANPPASMLRAFIGEPQQLSGRHAWHEKHDCRAEHGRAMVGRKPATKNEIVVKKN